MMHIEIASVAITYRLDMYLVLFRRKVLGRSPSSNQRKDTRTTDRITRVATGTSAWLCGNVILSIECPMLDPFYQAISADSAAKGTGAEVILTKSVS
jgi:hypothetical protein